MLKCPKCSITKNTFVIESWVLRVKGVVGLDDSNKIGVLGPLHAITTIERGKEIDSAMTDIICDCGYKGLASTFSIVVPSVLSGKEASCSFEVDGVTIHVTEDELELAHRIFSAENMFAQPGIEVLF